MRETGTATPGMRVARTLRRKAKTTRMTRVPEITRVRSTSFSELRMGGLRSTVTEILISRGMAACSCGSRPRIRSTVSMMLAPGDLKMTTITAVLPFNRPSVRTSSTESCDLAQIRQPHRRPVAEGHDQIPVLRRP